MSKDDIITFDNTKGLTIAAHIPGADWYEFTVKKGNIVHFDLSECNKRLSELEEENKKLNIFNTENLHQLERQSKEIEEKDKRIAELERDIIIKDAILSVQAGNYETLDDLD